MAHRVITCDRELADLGKLLGGLKLPITVEWRQGRDRSPAQNRLQFDWAREVSEQLGDRTADEVRCDWKLRHGVPIMRAESEAFRATYDEILKPLPYEQKVRMMQMVSVTSLMTVPQMSRYLDTVQRECLQMGLRLTKPGSDLSAHMSHHSKEASREAA